MDDFLFVMSQKTEDKLPKNDSEYPTEAERSAQLDMWMRVDRKFKTVQTEKRMER